MGDVGRQRRERKVSESLDVVKSGTSRKFIRWVGGAKHSLTEYIYSEDEVKKIAWARADIETLVVNGKENKLFTDVVSLSLVQSRSNLACAYDQFWS